MFPNLAAEKKEKKIKPLGITHVGIAVSDLNEAIERYQSLFDFDDIERTTVESEGIELALLKTGNTELELLSPTKKDEGSIAKFLRDRGEGLHHLAIRVPDVANAITLAKAMGLKVLDERPRAAALGAHAAFVHPKSLRGVLLEFYDR